MKQADVNKWAHRLAMNVMADADMPPMWDPSVGNATQAQLVKAQETVVAYLLKKAGPEPVVIPDPVETP